MTHVPADRPILQVIEAIVEKTSAIADFWGDGGWAPGEAGHLLSRSRLDWQVALSRTLSLWVPPSTTPASADADGRLILAWANLGALVEGALQWFLSVYLGDYERAGAAVRSKKGSVRLPDDLSLEPLRVFFRKTVWVPGDDYDSWILRIQQRRNAVHAYKERDIGSFAEFESDIRRYEEFLDDLDGRVPYPDEHP